jgi:hypothetical protein
MMSVCSRRANLDAQQDFKSAGVPDAKSEIAASEPLRAVERLVKNDKYNANLAERHAENARQASFQRWRSDVWCSPQSCRSRKLERLEPGGRVIGKRCGVSQNIGASARNERHR